MQLISKFNKGFRFLLRVIDIFSKFACVIPLKDKKGSTITNLSNLKSEVDKLDVDKLVPVPFDLSKLNGVVKNDLVKRDVYNAKTKSIERKIPHITNLAISSTLNAKINEVKGKIPSTTNLATTSAVAAVENKIPNVNNLVKKN